MNLVLDRMPASGSLALKALGSVRRKPRPDVELPRMSVSLDGVRFDAERLRAYRAICGFPDGGVPIPYPQVHAIGLQMHLLSQKQFPLPLVGLVHLKNRIVQERLLNEDEAFGVTVALVGDKKTERGLEFDLETTYTDSAKRVVWTAVATVLHRGKASGGRKRSAPPREQEGHLSEYQAIEAPGDIGRRYGRISGDMNPIHLYPLTAKLLGFDRHIAHGMWTLARSCALVQPHLGRAPRELTVQFRQPLFLPGRAALRYGPEGEGFGFTLVGHNGKTHLNGSLR
jgi:hypothetical protein